MCRQIEKSPDSTQTKIRDSRLEVPLAIVETIVPGLDC